MLMNVVIYLAAAVVTVPISKRLGLGSVIGYLVAGILIGPFGMKWISSVEEVMHFAEFGVVMLLFLIGLELNLSRLWEMRKAIFGAGTLQVLTTVILLSVLGKMVTGGWVLPFIAAMGFALSSTAIALQLLRERNLMKTDAGKTSFAVLLFQDLAVIPMLAIVPLLAPVSDHVPAKEVIHFLKPFGAVILIVAGGRYLLRPFFRYVARTHLREIFTATALLLVLAIAGLMQSVGLSMALGSFLAGVLLADSEYRHELEIDIEPFKGLLLGLFFIAVGMSIDLRLLLDRPALVLGMVVGILVIKLVILAFTGWIFKLGKEGNSSFSLALSQGGEFAFVLFGMAAQVSIITKTEANFLNLGIALTMLTTPFLMMANEKWFFCQWKRVGEKKAAANEAPPEQHPVILAGFGRFGQTIGRILHSLGVETTFLDHDPNQIELVRKFGWKTFYGDVSRLDLLHAAGADKASMLILAIDDPDVAVATCDLVKQHFPHLKIFARARSRTDAYQFVAREIPMVRETFQSALELTEKVLREMGFSAYEAKKVALQFRDYDYDLLERSAPHFGDVKKLMDITGQSREELSKLMATDALKLKESLNDDWG